MSASSTSVNVCSSGAEKSMSKALGDNDWKPADIARLQKPPTTYLSTCVRCVNSGRNSDTTYLSATAVSTIVSVTPRRSAIFRTGIANDVHESNTTANIGKNTFHTSVPEARS